MKTFFFPIILLLCLSSSANIDTTLLKSSVTDVTVFFSGAEVSREGKVNLNKGKHVILVDKLPQGIFPQSIQVEAIPKASILSVKQESAFYNVAESKAVKAVEKEIQLEKVKIQRLKNRIKVLDIEETFLLENSRLAGKEKGVTVEELKAAAGYYNNRLTAIRDEIVYNELKIVETKEQIVELFKKTNQIIQQNKQAFTKVYITLDCETAITNSVKVNYYLPNAGWVPAYDFRVQEISDPLKIIYNANVFQSSGEGWDKVNITLSSNNPSLSGNKPELDTWVLGQRRTYVDRNTPTAPALQIPNYGGVSAIKGKITDPESGDVIPFANISLLQNGESVLNTTTDFDGL